MHIIKVQSPNMKAKMATLSTQHCEPEKWNVARPLYRSNVLLYRIKSVVRTYAAPLLDLQIRIYILEMCYCVALLGQDCHTHNRYAPEHAGNTQRYSVQAGVMFGG